jgi:CRP/FNR family transcriptional regulator, cyclic AMP receptor protein
MVNTRWTVGELSEAAGRSSKPARDDPPVTVKAVFRSSRQTRSLAAGEVLFREGDPGAEMFGVISGAVELRRGDRVLAVVAPGGTFGELAIIDGGHRHTDAVATEPTELAVIDRRDFLFLVGETPTFALDVMRSMSTVIRALDAGV